MIRKELSNLMSAFANFINRLLIINFINLLFDCI